MTSHFVTGRTNVHILLSVIGDCLSQRYVTPLETNWVSILFACSS